MSDFGSDQVSELPIVRDGRGKLYVGPVPTVSAADAP